MKKKEERINWATPPYPPSKGGLIRCIVDGAYGGRFVNRPYGVVFGCIGHRRRHGKMRASTPAGSIGHFSGLKEAPPFKAMLST